MPAYKCSSDVRIDGKGLYISGVGQVSVVAVRPISSAIHGLEHPFTVGASVERICKTGVYGQSLNISSVGQD